jgi:hypothetical protein
MDNPCYDDRYRAGVMCGACLHSRIVHRSDGRCPEGDGWAASLYWKPVPATADRVSALLVLLDATTIGVSPGYRGE